jgi:hypothetical protein
MIVFKCKECDGIHVQEQMWVDMNTREIHNSAGDDSDMCWCDDCLTHVDVKVEKS